MKGLRYLLLAGIAVTASGGIAAAQKMDTVKVGMVRSITSGSTLIAIERGYYKEVGINVEWENLDTSATALASLAQNQFQVVMGGISAGFFNALDKNLPVAMAISRASTPIGHKLMLRPDLKDTVKSAKDLKGRVIASNGPGSISTYEIGKMLEPYGLTLNDVDVKVFPFTQYNLAFKNKAVDAALAIPPWTSQLEKDGFAIPFISADDTVKPAPLAISVEFFNTEWAKNNPDVARRYYLATLRGVRDYCQAYHGGAIRKEFTDVLIKTGTERRPEMLNEYTWPARDPYGEMFPESLLDMQKWYVENKFINKAFPIERLYDASFTKYAKEKLGPFEVENKASKLKGCGM
ncbi:MAG TPA: ABC transporter substrate-binding protein [Xanthobacteraceae bacterium]|nr:ABC transporter substrate-binding protein [Xanthobacteraceae bacterium]